MMCSMRARALGDRVEENTRYLNTYLSFSFLYLQNSLATLWMGRHPLPVQVLPVSFALSAPLVELQNKINVPASDQGTQCDEALVHFGVSITLNGSLQ